MHPAGVAPAAHGAPASGTGRSPNGGALAGIERAHNGMNAPNLSSREPPLGPAHLPVVTWSNDPVQAGMMSVSDIADLRRWHSHAAFQLR